MHAGQEEKSLPWESWMSRGLAVLAWGLLLALVTGSGLYLGGARRTFAGPAFLISAGLWVCLALRAVEGWQSGKRVIGWMDVPIFLFLAYAGWATLRAPCEYFARVEWLWASMYGAVFLSVRHQLGGRKIVPWILGWFLVVALITELYGFLHFRVGVYPIGPVEILGWEKVDRPDYEARMSGTFGCPNHFGNYLVQASIAGLTLMAWPGLVWPLRLLAGWSVLSSTTGVALSISRGSFLAWVASIGVWLGRWLRRGPLNWVGRGFVLILVCGGLAGGLWIARGDEKIMKRWDALVGQKGEGWDRVFSGEGNFRYQLALDGLEIWKKAPWFGHGPGSFDLEHLRWPSWKEGTRTVFTHNDYVNTLCDYGAVGFFFVALFWIYLGIFLWHRSRSRERDTPADLCTGLGWSLGAAMLTHAFVDFNYHIPATAISSFLLLGIATTTVWRERGMLHAKLLNGVLAALTLALAGISGVYGWKTWAGWRAVPEKAVEAAKLSDEALEKAGQEGERWDSRSPVFAETMGDAYRLKLIEVYFKPPAPSPTAVAERKEKLDRYSEAAILWYRRAEEQSPKDDVYYVRRASVLDLQGKFSEAEVLYQLGIQNRPNGKFFHVSYGNHLWRRGNLLAAQEQFEKAISVPGMVRPGDGAEKDATAEAKEMLARVKELIAKGGGTRQVKRFNPRED